MRLIRQAKAGDVNAFVKLCDSYIELVYQYLHFLVPTNRVAEGLTVQVFFKAWEQLEHYPLLDSSFNLWLYSIARDRVIEYVRTHKNNPAPDNAVTLAARGEEFSEEFQSIRDAMRSLTTDQQHVLVLKYIAYIPDKNIARIMGASGEQVRVLQIHALYALTERFDETTSITITKGFRRILEDCWMKITTHASTLDECLKRHPEFVSQLKPLLETALLLELGRDVKPLPTFQTYTHDALIQYLRTRSRRSRVMVTPALRRTALTFAMLVAAFLVTGTAYAQSAMPGEPFYAWKRTSELVLHALSPNSVATDIMLTERRLVEWIAVEDNPALSDRAMNDYQTSLSELKSMGMNNDAELALVASALQSQQEALTDAGLTSPALTEYLIEVAALLPDEVPPQTAPMGVPVTATPTVLPPAAISTDDCFPNCESNNGNNANNGGSNTDNNAGGNGNGNGNGIGNGNAGGNGGGNGNGSGSDNGGGNDDKGEKDNNGGGNDKNGK